MLNSALRRTAWTVLSLGAFTGGLGAFAALAAGEATGADPKGDRLSRMRASPQWRDGHFVNTLPPVEPKVWKELSRWLRGAPHTSPEVPIPIVRPPDEVLGQASEALRVTWLGHSTLLVELEGRRLLIDPVWGRRCSPVDFVGPERFHPPPLPLEELPPLDAVVISHDHYDHLDYPTVMRLAKRGVRFIVPLGVGAHLALWGVAEDRISELDWWGRTRVGHLELVATPARHFSGRSLTTADRDRTLWAGWAMIGASHRAYYSGDTAMLPELRDIGERLGPFDLTMIEVGAYDRSWADVHLGPEQAVAAHLMVRGRVMMPVHWGTFDLALHAWTEPAERVLIAAEADGVTLVTPRPGQSVRPEAPEPPSRWWPALPYHTVAEHPIVSSGLEGARRR